MALSFSLADIFVQFSVRGAEALSKTFEQIQGHLQKLQSGANAVASAMDTAFGRARTTLLGLVTAGIASSNMGEILGNRMAILSREVASLFIPEIMKAIDVLQRMINWFRSLSGEQQRNIAHWLMAGAAALSVATILPVVIGGINATVTALRAMTVAIVALESSTGLGALLPILGAVITAFGAFYVANKVSEDGLAGLWSAIEPIINGFKTLYAWLTPLGQAVGNLFKEFSPLWDVLLNIGKAIWDVIVPVFKILVAEITWLVNAMTPLTKSFIDFAQAILSWVIPPLKWLASFLERIAGHMSEITGVKFEGMTDKFKAPTILGAGVGTGAGHMSLVPRGSTGFESLTAAWERIAKSSLALGVKTPEEEQLDVMRQQLMEQKKINENLANTRPAIVR